MWRWWSVCWPLPSGFHYGTTPKGSYQHTPADSPAPQLYFGKKYHFVVIKSVGLTAVNCTFELGKPLRT